MEVIAVVQQKGGVGKTTLSINLAAEFFRREKRCALVDADPQASAVAWSAPKKLGFPVRQDLLKPSSIGTWVRDVMKLKADYVFIDTPAGLGPVFKAAVGVADLAVVPCGPSSLDLAGARETVAQIASMVRTGQSRAQVVLLPTRVDGSTLEGQQIAEELVTLGEAVGPALGYDPAFVRSFSLGVAVATLAPGGQASKQTRAAVDFLLAQLA